jgi:perosamine synthetase
MKLPVHRPFFGPEELAALSGVLESRWVGMGAATQEFERRIAETVGARHVVAVNTGTSALHLALDVLDLHEGDEVIVPSLTFVASVQAIIAAGGRPVFCEVCPDTLGIDVDDVRARITPRTRALMPVHFGGHACEMDALLALAREHDVRVVEDAAHAFGSRCGERPIGSFGDLTCFSFDPVKNITCIDGGAIATGDDTLAERLRLGRNLGIDRETWKRLRSDRPWHYEVAGRGYRYHLNDLNAAVGLVQLDRMESFRDRRLTIVRRYDEAFAGVDGVRPLVRDWEESFPFSYVVRVPAAERAEFMAALGRRGVGTGVHYIPNHRQPLFAQPGVSLPVTERVFDEIVTLPLFVEMTEVLILGTRSFAEDAFDVIDDTPGVVVTGFVENLDRARCADPLQGLPVHWVDELPRFAATHLAVCALSTTHRSRFTAQAEAHGMRFATVVHPTARVSTRSTLGEGTLVGPGVVIAAFTTLGRHVIVNRAASIGHHTTIGDHVSVQPGANVAGACDIRDAAYIGMGATVIDKTTVGAHAVVGAGAVVTKDVPERVLVLGVPARIVKEGISGK